MTNLSKGIALGVWALFTAMTVLIGILFSIYSIRHHRTDGVVFARSVAKSAANNLERFILWEDRETVRRLLGEAASSVKADFGFVELGGHLYASSSDEPVPRGLTALETGPRGGPGSETVFAEGRGVLYDVSVPLIERTGRFHLVLSRRRIDGETASELIWVWACAVLSLAIGWWSSRLIALVATREVGRALDRLAESEARSRAILDTVPLGILKIDLAGKILWANPGCSDITGWTEAELRGRASGGFLSRGSSRIEFARVLERGFSASGRKKSIRVRIAHKSGREIVLGIAWSPRRSAGGAPAGLILAAADVTARQKFEDERRDIRLRSLHSQNLESLGVLAGGVAHDFNNLLGAIMGNAQLSLEDIRDIEAGAVLKRRLCAISKIAAQAAGLCRQLLIFAGRAKPSMRTIDAAKLMGEMAPVIEVAVPKRMETPLRLGEGGTFIRADCAQIQRLILNLVTNAAEAVGDRPGRVSISTARVHCGENFLRESYFGEEAAPGEYVRIEVSDDGCGMSKKVKEGMFRPFFTTKKFGKGLGLAGVAGTVRGHRGVVRIRSSPGEGTDFAVYLPAAPSLLEEENTPGDGAGCWRGSGRVLVADDEAAMRLVAREILAGMGLSVVDCTDGREASVRFRAGPGDFVLAVLDLSMPGLGGVELLREIRAARPCMPVVLTSGYDKNDAVGSLGEGECSGFVSKPYDVSTFRAEIGRVMRAAGMGGRTEEP